MTAGAPGMPRSGPRLALSMSAALTTSGLAALPVTKRADARVQDGVQCVADADIERTGVTGHDDRGVAQPGIRPEERQDRAHRDHDDRQHAARDERKRLCPHRIVQHADVATQQRVFHPAHQKSIPADLQPGCRLTSHIPPAPSLMALGGMAFHQFGVSRETEFQQVSSRTSPAAIPFRRSVLRVGAGRGGVVVLAEGLFRPCSETALTTSRTGWKSLSPLLSGRLVFDPFVPRRVALPGLGEDAEAEVRCAQLGRRIWRRPGSW